MNADIASARHALYLARLWSKVNKDGPTQPHMTTPCWIWTAGKHPAGYGIVITPDGTGRISVAHRVTYELAKGPIPAGLFVLHECDVRTCVNPDHLRVGTQADNVQDAIRRGRRKGVVKQS